MKVLNIHERELPESAARVGALIDSLSSREDALWPKHCWPRMELDRPLSVGAAGGHGPIRYCVEAYAPGRAVQFRFTEPIGFDGHHRYEVISSDEKTWALRHTLEMHTRGLAVAAWLWVFRPMHDALIEDSLAAAEVSLGHAPKLQPWSAWVRTLRWVVPRGRARAQVPPDSTAHRAESASEENVLSKARR